MGKAKTAEDACSEYAITVAEVRRLTKLLNPTDCVRYEAYNKAWAGCGPDEDGLKLPDNPPEMPETCLTIHWRVITVPAYPSDYREEPELPYEEMCEACKTRLKIVQERKVARKLLGAAKRSVEAVGKRMNVVVMG